MWARKILTVASMSLSVVAFIAGPSKANAGWVGFRNDLGQAVVIQSSSATKNQARQGNPQYVYPGETTWEWVPDHGVRTITISTASTPKTALYRLEVSAPDQGDQLFAIQREGKSGDVRVVKVHKPTGKAKAMKPN